jgi:capsular polysaccharide biosynthesis protein
MKRHGITGHAFFSEKIKITVDIIPKRVYNKNIERREKAMGKKKKKKPINWIELAINAVIDLIVGVILILIEKYLS